MFRFQRNRAKGPRLLITAALMFSLHSATVSAEYQDPIDLSAIKMASSQQSLLLDVAKAGNRLVAVGERGHILYSDDLGQNWIQADVDSRAHLNAVTFIDANTGWALGEDQVIVQSTDGGQSWQRQYDDRDAEQRGPLLDLYFKSAQQGFAIGVFNKLLRTADGGQSWQPWQEHIDNIDEWHLFAIAAAGPNNIYIASEMGLVFRSRDGGEQFEVVQTDHDGSFHGILVRPGSDGNDQLVLFGVGGVLYTSTDGGDSWNLLDTGVETGLASGTWLDDGSALIVGADGLILSLESDLQQIHRTSIDNGLPLSAVAVAGDKSATLVGLGGIQSLGMDQLKGLK